MCEAGAPKESPGTSRKPRTVVVVGGPMGALIVIGEAEGRGDAMNWYELEVRKWRMGEI
jgi:hypothetical protein